ncbi:MAG: hypothetical protein ACREV5_05140 [Steroidobacter sp.]
MHRSLRFDVLAVVLLIALSGCISTAERQAPIPPKASIVILTPGHPDKLIFANYADAKTFIPFYGFGKQMQAMSTEPIMNSELAARGFRVQEQLQDALVRDIRSKSIDARAVQIARAAEFIPSALKRSELPAVQADWAVIDARITGYGLLAEISGEFRPFVCVIARMIDAKTKQVLYEKRFAYNYGGAKVVRISFDPVDKWPTIEAVKNDLPGVEAAIGRGISKITDLIAADLAAK